MLRGLKRRVTLRDGRDRTDGLGRLAAGAPHGLPRPGFRHPPPCGVRRGPAVGRDQRREGNLTILETSPNRPQNLGERAAALILMGAGGSGWLAKTAP